LNVVWKRGATFSTNIAIDTISAFKSALKTSLFRWLFV